MLSLTSALGEKAQRPGKQVDFHAVARCEAWGKCHNTAVLTDLRAGRARRLSRTGTESDDAL